MMPAVAPRPNIRRNTMASTRSGIALARTMRVRAVHCEPRPIRVGRAAKRATGIESTTESRVARNTIAKVSTTSETVSPNAGKSSGTMREKNPTALSNDEAIVAMSIPSDHTDQAPATARPMSTMTATAEFPDGRGRRGSTTVGASRSSTRLIGWLPPGRPPRCRTSRSAIRQWSHRLARSPRRRCPFRTRSSRSGRPPRR